MARELGVYSTGEIEWKFATKKPTPSFWQAGCPSCRPTNSVKALKGIWQDLCLDYISIIEQIFETVGFSMPEKLGPWKSDRVKVKVHAFDIVPLRSESAPQKRSGMARVLNGSHSFTCTPHVHPQSEWAIPAFAFPAAAGTHLPTPEGWKAE